MIKNIFKTIILKDPPIYFKIGLDILITMSLWIFLFYYFNISGYNILGLYLILLIFGNLLFKVYKSTYRYFNISDLLKIFFITIGSFIISVISTKPEFGESLIVNFLFSSVIVIIIPRLLLKLLFSSKIDNQKTKALIYGAGENGIYFKRAYQNNLGFHAKQILLWNCLDDTRQ